MSIPILFADIEGSELRASPITREWILEGAPEARNAVLAKSGDKTSYTLMWDCTAGRFDWHYDIDETIVVKSGEAFINDRNGGGERRVGPGDVVFFPAGASATWRVPSYIQKIAFFRQTMPAPVAFGVRVWNLLMRKLRRTRGSGL